MSKHTHHHKTESKELVMSYLNLRKTIGFLGFFFPIILVLGTVFCGANEIYRSISFYYHTIMQNVFVAVMCVTGLFLFSYKGHKWYDDLLGDLGCVFALGVAFMPTDIDTSQPTLVGNLHLASATLFFLVLISFSLFLFTKRDKKEKFKKAKKNRNLVFYICGFIMLACILLIAAYKLICSSGCYTLKGLHPIFWLEAIALWAFGISWLTKGQVIFKDVTNKEKN